MPQKNFQRLRRQLMSGPFNKPWGVFNSGSVKNKHPWGIGGALQYSLRPTRHGDSTLRFFGLLYYSKSTPTSPYKCSRSRGQRDKDIQRWVSLTFSINTWLHLHPPINILALVANETRNFNVEYLWPSVSMHGFTYNLLSRLIGLRFGL